jgi:hypothetical protein
LSQRPWFRNIEDEGLRAESPTGALVSVKGPVNVGPAVWADELAGGRLEWREVLDDDSRCLIEAGVP